jgi:hypothetical protein
VKRSSQGDVLKCTKKGDQGVNVNGALKQNDTN